MKIKQTIKKNVAIMGLALGLTLVAAPVMVNAATCGGVTTSILSCPQTSSGTCADGSVVARGEPCADGSDPKTKTEDTGVWGLLVVVINIMTAGIGIVAVAGIVYGSILYASAGGSPDQTKKAMEVIRNVVIGILAYALMYAALNFIIPGGLFS